MPTETLFPRSPELGDHRAQPVVDEYYAGWTMLVNDEAGAADLIKHSATAEFRGSLSSYLMQKTPPEPGGWEVSA